MAWRGTCYIENRLVEIDTGWSQRLRTRQIICGFDCLNIFTHLKLFVNYSSVKEQTLLYYQSMYVTDTKLVY